MTDSPLLEQLLTESEIGDIYRVVRSSVYEERIERSDFLKGKAALELEKKSPVNAMVLYLGALYHLDFSGAQNLQFIPDHLFQVEDLQSKVLANLSLCYFLSGNFFLSRRSADLALPLSKTAALSAKIRYRHALALNGLRDFDAAAISAQEALTLLPGDAKVAELLREILINRDEEQRKADEMFRGKLKTSVPEVVVEEKKTICGCCRRRKTD